VIFFSLKNSNIIFFGGRSVHKNSAANTAIGYGLGLYARSIWFYSYFIATPLIKRQEIDTKWKTTK